jgi:hypothetical protein
MSLGVILLSGFLLYVAVGVCVAAAFVCRGVTQVQPMSATVGARLLIFPGAAALWPYVLRRWIAAGRKP